MYVNTVFFSVSGLVTCIAVKIKPSDHCVEQQDMYRSLMLWVLFYVVGFNYVTIRFGLVTIL
jgi:hypothetical protein